MKIETNVRNSKKKLIEKLLNVVKVEAVNFFYVRFYVMQSTEEFNYF